MKGGISRHMKGSPTIFLRDLKNDFFLLLPYKTVQSLVTVSCPKAIEDRSLVLAVYYARTYSREPSVLPTKPVLFILIDK